MLKVSYFESYKLVNYTISLEGFSEIDLWYCSDIMLQWTIDLYKPVNIVFFSSYSPYKIVKYR